MTTDNISYNNIENNDNLRKFRNVLPDCAKVFARGTARDKELRDKYLKRISNCKG